MSEQTAHPNAASLRGFGQWLHLWGDYMLAQARLLEEGLISEAELPLPPAPNDDEKDAVVQSLPDIQPPAHWLETAVTPGPPAHWLALFEEDQNTNAQPIHADAPLEKSLSAQPPQNQLQENRPPGAPIGSTNLAMDSVVQRQVSSKYASDRTPLISTDKTGDTDPLGSLNVVENLRAQETSLSPTKSSVVGNPNIPVEGNRNIAESARQQPLLKPSNAAKPSEAGQSGIQVQRVRLNISHAAAAVTNQTINSQDGFAFEDIQDVVQAHRSQVTPAMPTATAVAKRVTRVKLSPWPLNTAHAATAPASDVGSIEKEKTLREIERSQLNPPQAETAVIKPLSAPQVKISEFDKTPAEANGVTEPMTPSKHKPKPSIDTATEEITTDVEPDWAMVKKRPLVQQDKREPIKWSSTKPKPWPKLPDPPPMVRETQNNKRQQARIERLRREQKGELWNE